MMNNDYVDKYERELISTLLDRYEASVFFKTATAPTHRIMLTLYDGGKTNFPSYDIEKPELRERINRAVIALSEKNLAGYQWMRGELNHFIAKVWLNYDNLANAYSFIKREPANDAAGNVCAELLDAMNRVKSAWIKNFLNDCHQTIVRKRKLTGMIGLPHTKEERGNLISALVFADNKDEPELLERVFSIQCFGDSKKFDTVKNQFINIIKHYHDCDSDASDEELLRLAGISKYPEQFEFRGPLSIHFDQASIDFSVFTEGAGCNSRDIKRAAFSIAPNIKRVLSIENRANFFDYIYRQKNEDELVVYHGGQFSVAKGLFLKMLSRAIPPNCVWEHWSDIDYGGFAMLARLRHEIKTEVLPWRMHRNELMRYIHFTTPISAHYAEKLKTLVVKKELADCAQTIEYMIEKKIRLEQEAMLT
jgi:hypothetical protein